MHVLLVCNQVTRTSVSDTNGVAKGDVQNGHSVWGPNRWGNQRPGHLTPLDSADLL